MWPLRIRETQIKGQGSSSQDKIFHRLYSVDNTKCKVKESEVSIATDPLQRIHVTKDVVASAVMQKIQAANIVQALVV